MPEALPHVHLDVRETPHRSKALDISEHQRRREHGVHLTDEQPHRLAQVSQRPTCNCEGISASRQVRGSGCMAHAANPPSQLALRAQETQHGLSTALRHTHEKEALALMVQKGHLVVNKRADERVGALHGSGVQHIHPGNTSREGAHIRIVVPRSVVGKHHDHAHRAHALWQGKEVFVAVPWCMAVQVVQADDGADMIWQARCDERRHGV
mmetsp:Transcript_86459/g.201150  ORF Transcript_86459/g.201150 Transcript_86459/m.201150 type:complete len:210 (-) Transcript_86459:827-1456(-)